MRCSTTLTALVAIFVVGGCITAPDTFPDDPDVVDGSLDAVLDEYTDFSADANSSMEVIVPGQAAWDATMDLIASARHHIHIETLHFVDDPADLAYSTDRIVEALSAKAARGVSVRVVTDPLGQIRWSGVAAARKLEAAGVEVRPYHTDWDNSLMAQAMHRMHKKILVVDGRQAIIGGRNYGDKYYHDDTWRDTTVVLAGPVVNTVQREFARDWQDLGEPLPDDDAFYPALDPTGNVAIRMVDQRPAANDFDINTAVLAAIRSARQSITIESPYLNPTPPLIEELTDAAARGVDVRIITNARESANVPPDYFAQAFWFHRWVDGNVRIFLWDIPGCVLHSKTMVVDDSFAMIGSYNFNYRGIMWDTENAVVVTDPDTVGRIAAMIEADFNREGVFEIDRAWIDADTADDQDLMNIARFFSWLL